MQATFRIWRSNPGETGGYQDYRTDVSEGMVVLDAVHQIQAEQAPDLACRWNCKAGKCGSCSAEINGKPRLMCMTRLSTLNLHEPVTVEPMRAFPPIKDLVTDVSWNFRVKKTITPFTPRPADAADGTWRMQQADVDRVHLQVRGVDEEARTDELAVLVVIPQHVADVLAQEALDALAEFLNPVDVLLRDAPRAVGGIGRARLELPDPFLDAGIP